MSRLWHLGRSAVVLAVSLTLVQACADNVGIFSSKPTQSEVLELAKSYDFVNPTGPIPAANPLPDGTGVPANQAPTSLTIERAVPKVSPAPEGKVILARVHSDKAYQHLGIEEGDNYIWVDRHLPKLLKHWWRTYMVPAKAGSDAKRLKRSDDEYSHGDPTEPRLVMMIVRGIESFGACLDDPNCGSGHCGFGDVE